MTKHKHEQHPMEPKMENSDVRAPYWRRAHRDWRFIAVVFIMLAAITTYVLTLDLSVRSKGAPLPLLVIDGK